MRGVTLVETLVAMYLIAMVSLFCLGLFSQLSQGVHQSRFRYAAAVAADTEIASWRSLPMREPTTVTNTVNYNTVWMGRSTGRKIQLQTTTANTTDDRQVITVTASWSEPSGPARLVVESVRTN